MRQREPRLGNLPPAPGSGIPPGAAGLPHATRVPLRAGRGTAGTLPPLCPRSRSTPRVRQREAAAGSSTRVPRAPPWGRESAVPACPPWEAGARPAGAGSAPWRRAGAPGENDPRDGDGTGALWLPLPVHPRPRSRDPRRGQAVPSSLLAERARRVVCPPPPAPEASSRRPRAPLRGSRRLVYGAEAQPMPLETGAWIPHA